VEFEQVALRQMILAGKTQPRQAVGIGLFSACSMTPGVIEPRLDITQQARTAFLTVTAPT
jgi:hypothetical protein